MVPADPQITLSLKHANDKLAVTIGEVKHLDAWDGKVYAKSVLLANDERRVDLVEQKTEEIMGSSDHMDATMEVNSKGRVQCF